MKCICILLLLAGVNLAASKSFLKVVEKRYVRSCPTNVCQNNCNGDNCNICNDNTCCTTRTCNSCVNTCFSQCETRACNENCVDACAGNNCDNRPCSRNSCSGCPNSNSNCGNNMNNNVNSSNRCTTDCSVDCEDKEKVIQPVTNITGPIDIIELPTPNIIVNNTDNTFVNLTTQVNIQNVINNYNNISTPVFINTTNINFINVTNEIEDSAVEIIERNRTIIQPPRRTTTTEYPVVDPEVSEIFTEEPTTTPAPRTRRPTPRTTTTTEIIDIVEPRCCYILHPKQCYTEKNGRKRCVVRRHRECSDMCTSPVVAITERPQVVEPSGCYYVQNYPYVYCGNYERQDCSQCFMTQCNEVPSKQITPGLCPGTGTEPVQVQPEGQYCSEGCRSVLPNCIPTSTGVACY